MHKHTCVCTHIHVGAYRAREIKEELEDRLEEDEQSGGAQFLQGTSSPFSAIPYAPTYYVDPSGARHSCHPCTCACVGL